MLLGCVACDGASTLDLRVDLKTDYVGGAEVRVATMTLYDGDDQVVGTESTQLTREDLTEGVRIGDLADLKAGRYRVVVELEGQLSVPTRTVLLDLSETYGVTVVIARGCADVTCPDGGDPTLTECVGGRCVSPECTPETPEACPAPECTSDSECTSSATCAEAACVGGYCTARPDSSSCFVAQYCNPEAGCVVQPCNEHDDCGRCARCGGTECQAYSASAIYAGHQSACLIDDLGERWCWGNDPNAELGMGEPDQYRSFPRNAGDGEWTEVQVGWTAGVGVRSDGTIWSWGGSRQMPEQIAMGGWEQASLVNGDAVWIGLDGSLWHDGEQVGTDTDWYLARAGWNHACAIKDSGELYCWGENDSGQLGIDTGGESVEVPTQVGTDADWNVVSGGEVNSCGVRFDGTLWCWGSDYGATPTQVGTDTDWEDFRYKWQFGCGIKLDASIHCMGGDSDGELGRGPDGEASLVPEPIALDGPWHGLTVGGHFACAYNDRLGGWYCWGAGFGLGAGREADEDESGPVPLCPADRPDPG